MINLTVKDFKVGDFVKVISNSPSYHNVEYCIVKDFYDDGTMAMETCEGEPSYYEDTYEGRQVSHITKVKFYIVKIKTFISTTCKLVKDNYDWFWKQNA